MSSGWAEAGICVKPAAAEAHVRFIPLHKEAYELCVADDQFDDPRIQALVATLQSTAYRRLIADVLVTQGFTVLHILGRGDVARHVLAAPAWLDHGVLTYRADVAAPIA